MAAYNLAGVCMPAGVDPSGPPGPLPRIDFKRIHRLPPMHVRMIVQGQPVCDEATLLEGAVVHVVWALRGGGGDPPGKGTSQNPASQTTQRTDEELSQLLELDLPTSAPFDDTDPLMNLLEPRKRQMMYDSDSDSKNENENENVVNNNNTDQPDNTDQRTTDQPADTDSQLGITSTKTLHWKRKPHMFVVFAVQ
eukprot:gene19002-6339_t